MQAQQPYKRFLHLRAGYHAVNEAFFQQKLGALKALGKLLPHRLLNHAAPREPYHGAADWMKKNGEAYYKAVAMMHEYDFAPCIEDTMKDLLQKGIHGLNQIVPRYDSVKDFPGLLPVENYKEILKSKKKLTQNQCACRTRYPEYGQDDHVCISADETADFMIAHNLGHEISWEEMFDYIQKSAGPGPPLPALCGDKRRFPCAAQAHGGIRETA